MSGELKEGTQLARIQLIPDPEEGPSSYQIGVEAPFAREIVVSEQLGQIGMVPWARVTKHSGTVVLVNLANVESVALLDDEVEDAACHT